jgi:hypothetical protein
VSVMSEGHHILLHIRMTFINKLTLHGSGLKSFGSGLKYGALDIMCASMNNVHVNMNISICRWTKCGCKDIQLYIYIILNSN